MNFQTTIQMTLSEKQLKRLGINIKKTYLERHLLNHKHQNPPYPISEELLFDMVEQRIPDIPIEDLTRYVKVTLQYLRKGNKGNNRDFMKFWVAVEFLANMTLTNMKYCKTYYSGNGMSTYLFNDMEFQYDDIILPELRGNIKHVLKNYFPWDNTPSVFDIVEAKAQKKAVDIIKSKWLEIYYSPRHPVGIKRFERELDKLGLE